MSTKTVPTVYQQCPNRQKTVKTAKMIIGVPIVTGLPRLYQQFTNSVPIVKNSQKTVETAKMTIGVPIITGLPRLYQQCNNHHHHFICLVKCKNTVEKKQENTEQVEPGS